MRESVGLAAVSDDLRWHENERDIDRVTALGAAGILTPLGVALYRVYVANDRHAYWEAMARLAKLVRTKNSTRLPYSWREAIAKQAMNEVVFPMCTRCMGSREIMQDQLTIPCTQCDGSGVRKFSDEERAKAIGVEILAFRRVFDDPLRDALCILSAHAHQAKRKVNEALETCVVSV